MDLQIHVSKLQTYLKENQVSETTVLIPELNVLAQDFFDSVRSSEFQSANDLSQQVYEVCFAVYNLDHWVRKLTAATVLANLLNAYPDTFGQYTGELQNTARTLLNNKKREVRDSSARLLAQLPEQQFNKVLENVAPGEGDTAEFREALSVMCGYKLSKEHNDICVNYLFENLTFTGKSSIETNYVHWYTQRSFIKAMLAKESGDQISSNEELYNKMKLSFSVDEMKVRKSAADAAAIYYASDEENLKMLFHELQTIIDENLNSQKANYYIQTVLMAASVYIQIMMGKHISYSVSKYVISQDNSVQLQSLLIQIYKQINDVFIDQKTLSGMYKGAIVTALIPESLIIKNCLCTSYVKQIEGALDAIIFMQKSFKQPILEYKLELLLFNQFHNQSIAVNALRCLQYYDVVENNQEYNRNSYDFNDINVDNIIKFCMVKMGDESAEIRHCACQLLIRYFTSLIQNNGDLLSSNIITATHLNNISMALVALFDQKYLRQQGNSITLKTAGELMSLIAKYLTQPETEALIKVSEKYFLDRDDYCGQLGKFYTLVGCEKYAQMCLIYAFDAINVQLSDYCKTFVGAAAQLFNENVFIETVKQHFLQDDSENLYLNGVSRLLFGLKTYKNMEISQQLLDLMDEILEKACDFFDEVTDIFKVYQNAIINDDATDVTVESQQELSITGQEEFDPEPKKTIALIKSQLRDNKSPTNVKEIILSTTGWESEFAKKTYEQIIPDTRVKVELKQLLAAAMLPSSDVFNHEVEIDVRRNEVFDFNRING